MARLVSAVLSTSLLVAIESVSAQGLVSDCTLPFVSIAKRHPIDDNCAARGEVPDPPVAANESAQAIQNQAKNNFCATGAAALVTFTSFKRLRRSSTRKYQRQNSGLLTNCPRTGVFSSPSIQPVRAPRLAKGLL
jgi:hypothetical protein